MKTKSKLHLAREANELAKLNLQTTLLTRKTDFYAKYDATESNRSRRNGTIEYQDEGEIYNMSKRLVGCNLGRDLERNYSPAKGMLHQFRMNVVGALGKLNVNIKDDPAAKEATAWFNEVWAKDCDYRDEVHWSTVLQNIVAGVIREGDLLAVVDDQIIEDTGKLVTWESDQIVPVNDAVLKSSSKAARYRTSVDGKVTLPIQDKGILRNVWGKVLGYTVTGRRGLICIDKEEDATFYPREQARLIRNPWRLNQGRGIPSLLTASSNFIDLYEILASELQSAKKAAKQYANVKRENAVTDWDNPSGSPEYLPENDGKTAAQAAADGANETTKTGARNYEHLETFTGGLTDYLDAADKVEFPPVNRPNAQLAAFLEAVHGYGGAAMGLARVYTTLAASTSYTAFRGEQMLTWYGAFYPAQKWLERSVADWVAVKVLTWAIRKGHIPKLAPGWERKLSWSWPIMPEVNPLDYENSVAMSLKNGTTDYSELLGPDWRERLSSLSEQIDFIREEELPLSVLEAKSGGAAPGKEEDVKAMAANDDEIKPDKEGTTGGGGSEQA